MLYNLDNSYQREQAISKLNLHLKDHHTIEITRKLKKRTQSQNRYIHVLFGLWGCEFGYTLKEAKRVVKEELGYTYEKEGRTFEQSTAEMNTLELSQFTEKFRNWSAGDKDSDGKYEGCYLPSPEDYRNNYTEIDNTLMSHKIYL